MGESEFERLEKNVNRMVECFARLRVEKNDLATRLARIEKIVVDLRRQVEELNNRKDQARQRLDGLISQLEKLDF
jgi:FtsZ-binding cell division protein ZapB